MGIESRDYLRKYRGLASDWSLDGLTPVVKWIIIVNIAVFVLQIIGTRVDHTSGRDRLRQANPDLYSRLVNAEKKGPEAVAKLKKIHPEVDYLLAQDDEDVADPHPTVSVIQEWFELDPAKVVYRGEVWRLLTHAFCHDRSSIFHILFNMFFLYWFGRTLEMMYGSREFLLFYLTAAVIAGLAFIALQLYTRSLLPAVGASGALMAVVMLYTVHFPYETTSVWFFSVQMRWIMLFFVISDLHPVLLALVGDRFGSEVANAAHLGGLAFGFFYGWQQWRLEPLLDRFQGMRTKVRNQGRLRVVRPDEPPPSQADQDTDRVDEVLRKIADAGQGSLTPEEIAFLKQTSERLRTSRQDRHA